MKRKTVFVIILSLVLIAVTAGIAMLTQVSTSSYTAQKDGKTTKKVICSFYPVYIAAMNIAKDVPGLEIVSLSQPQTGCLHDYQMTSEDVKLLENADLLICNGGGMEFFVNSSEYAKKYPGLKVVYASENLPVNELDEENAHYWMDPDLYEIYAQKVAIALSDFDTENAGIYMENYAAYVEKIEKVIKLRDELDLKGRKIINLSDALYYMIEDVGLETAMFIDLEEEESVSADTIAKACDIIKSENAVILYDFEGVDVAKTLMNETGAKGLCINVITTGDYIEDAWISGMTDDYNVLKELQ